LKSLVVVLVWRPGLSVNREVLVAELIVDLSGVESFPIGVWHCCLKLRITFLFSRQGAGMVKIEVKSARPKNNELLPSGLNHGSDNKFKTASLSSLLPIWTLKKMGLVSKQASVA
jgi:hypothetical protein